MGERKYDTSKLYRLGDKWASRSKIDRRGHDDTDEQVFNSLIKQALANKATIQKEDTETSCMITPGFGTTLKIGLKKVKVSGWFNKLRVSIANLFLPSGYSVAKDDAVICEALENGREFERELLASAKEAWSVEGEGFYNKPDKKRTVDLGVLSIPDPESEEVVN